MGNDINNLLCQCGCANKAQIDLKESTQFVPIKQNLISENKASQKIKKLLIYALHKRKSQKLHNKYTDKINNLLLLCSKYKTQSKLSPSDFQLLLQKRVNVILEYVNANNSIEINKDLFKNISRYESVYDNVRNFYVKDIKENQLHFYKEVIEKQKIDIDEEIKKMMSFKWNKLFTLYLNELFIVNDDLFQNKKFYLSKNIKLFIKRFYFMYMMYKYKYVHTEKSFRKICLDNIIKLYITMFMFNGLNKECLLTEDELSLQGKNTQMKTMNNSLTTKENNDDFSTSVLQSNLTNGNNTSKAMKNYKARKNQRSNTHNKSNVSQEAIHFRTRIEKPSNLLLLTKQSTSSFSNIYSTEVNISYYKGDFDNNYFPQCKGELINSNEQSYYIGTFRYAQFHGVGCFYQIISDSAFMFYKGEFHKGLQQGYGIKIVVLKNVYKIYKGLFIANHIHIGIEYIFEEIEDGQLVFTVLEGEFLNDEYIGTRATRVGNEILTENGKKSEKIFKMNKLTYHYDLLSSYQYEGTFLKGKEHGDGKVILVDKENNYSYEYVGGFKDGTFHGYGTIIYSENYFIRKYEGLFYNDQKFYLYGQVIFKSGDCYEGFFDKNFLKSYLGLYIHYNPNGSYENYFGGYEQDMKSGLGRFVNLDSQKVLIGTYMKGIKSGNFTLINSNCGRINTNEELYQSESDRIPRKNIQHKQYFMFNNDELVENEDV